jgi:hypothetical protein
MKRTQVSRVNISLLRRTQITIAQNASRFHVDGDGKNEPIEYWALVAAGINPDSVTDAYTCAKKLLRLTSPQSAGLFIGYGWPLKLAKKYVYRARSDRARRRNAKLAIDRIEHFISRGV